jgi:uncharacterized Zn-binding protein involved in type VI secretion
MSRRIACLGDSSDHGGTLTNTNQDDRLKIAGIKVCAHGCSHSCPIPGHGTTSVSAIAAHSYVNGKLIITTDATAGCGAKMTPPDRKVYVE